MSIIATVSLYGLVRELGAEAALAEFQRQLREPLDPNALACVRAITRFRGVAGDLVLHADIGASATPKMRSRAAHAAWESGAELWISVDDDVECTFETARALHDAARGDEPRVVIAPCWLRGRVVGGTDELAPCINVGFEPDAADKARQVAEGVVCWPAIAGGFGLVAINRAALAATRAANSHLEFRDDDGETRVGLFHEVLEDGRWWGEDLSFFRRLPPEVQVEMLVTGHTAHAGMVLDLATVGELTRMNLVGFRPTPKVHEAVFIEPITLEHLVDVPTSQ